MNDFVVIKKPHGTRLMPGETVDLFQVSKRSIFETLAAANSRKTVIVTWRLSPYSHEWFRGDSLNCAFMTDLSGEIIDHGSLGTWPYSQLIRLHPRQDRVVVNPYGYKDVEVNPRYDRQMAIEL